MTNEVVAVVENVDKNTLDMIISWIQFLFFGPGSLIIGALISGYLVSRDKNLKGTKLIANTLLLTINAMKKEDEMENGKFSEGLKDSVAKKAEEMNLPPEVTTLVTNQLDKINTGEIKLGSINGKPIYMEDVDKTINDIKSVEKAFKAIKNIFKKKN